MNAPFKKPIDIAQTETVFVERCEARALLVINGALSLHEAVDELQAYAKLSGLIDRIGLDVVQEIMGIAFALAETLPDDEACEPPASDTPRSSPRPYRTPEATEHAFWYVVRLGDADDLRRWLARHPLDAPHLLEIWERKNAVA